MCNISLNVVISYSDDVALPAAVANGIVILLIRAHSAVSSYARHCAMGLATLLVDQLTMTLKRRTIIGFL